MSKHTATIDANESVEICSVSRGTDMDAYEVTVFATGAFGSGTVTIQASPDGGTTKVTLKDVGGTTVSITQDDVYNIRLGYAGKLGEEIKLYATMQGATDPDVAITAFDNR
jgi:hypothetical protein